MAYDHKNTNVNITILVVDDDPIILSIIPSMLKTPIYKDKSFGEITVMTAKDSSEAMSTLRGQCNKIDFVITDYHMPGLNGIQLKRIIDEEFGNLPVIVISADMSNAIQHESLSSGAMCFIRKPIDSSDLNIVWQHAANCNMNDGSKRIQESSSTNNPYDGDETDPTNHPIDVDGDSTNPNDGDSGAQVAKKPKLKWTNSLYNQFLDAIERIGLDKAVPKKILETMNVKDLTRAQVASKLQKYRKFLKEVKDNGTDLTSVQLSRRGVNSNFVSSSYIDQQHSNNSNTSLGNNNDILSQLRYGVGQSNFMIHNNPSKSQLSYGVGQANVTMNNNAFKSQLSYGVGQPNFRNNNAGSHDSIHYMNRRPTYDMSQTGSDLMSMRTNFGVPNGMLPLMEKSVNIFGTSQDSQAPKFGQFDTTSNVLGLSSNLTTGHMGGNYAGIELSENGDLVAPGGIRVHGNGNSSLGENLGAMNWKSNNTNMSNHGNGDLVASGGIKVHGNGNSSLGKNLGAMNWNSNNTNMSDHRNGDLVAPGGIKVHGNGNSSLGENLGAMNWNSNNTNMSDHGNGDLVAPGGIKVNGNGNSSLGENLGAMNWKSNNTNMSNHGSGNLVAPGGIRVHGNGNSSLGENLGAMNWKSNNTNMSNHGSGNLAAHGGIRVHGNGNGSFGENLGAMNWKSNNTNMSNHGSGNLAAHGRIRVHGNGNGSLGENLGAMNWKSNNTNMSNNGSGNLVALGGIRVHGNGNSSLGENLGAMNWNSNNTNMNNHGNGNLVVSGGIRVHSNGNISLGENLGAMNWNSNNTNMSNHGSSTLNFSSALSPFMGNQNQPHSNFIAQTDGVVPVLENPSIFNDHHGINEGFNNTINSQIDQHQNQGEVTGENFGVPTGDLLERNEILAPIPPPEDISNWSFNNDNYNDGTLNSVVANSQMQFPTHDLNMTNQELGVGDAMEFSLSFDKDWDDEALHMLESLLGTDMI